MVVKNQRRGVYAITIQTKHTLQSAFVEIISLPHYRFPQRSLSS